MARHSRNNCAGSVYTYAERRQRTDAGRQYEDGVVRSSDAVLRFGTCFMCMNDAVQPQLCSRDGGHVGCKECFIKSILTQKKQRRAKLQDLDESAAQASAAKDTAANAEFLQQQSVVSKEAALERPNTDLPFWSTTMKSRINRGERLDKRTLCLADPCSEHVFSLDSLVPLRLVIRDGHATCLLCEKPIRSRAVVIVECGHVFCRSCRPVACHVCPHETATAATTTTLLI